MKIASDDPEARTASLDLVRRYLAARQSRDRSDDLLSDDLSWTVPKSFMLAPDPDEPVLRGKSLILFYWRNIATEWLQPGSIRLSDERFVAAGDTVAHSYFFSAEAHNGSPVNSRSATIYTVRNGRIAAIADYFDTAEWRAKVLPGVLGGWPAARLEEAKR